METRSAKRATIRDVAEKAGVGAVTVSYVLNGRSKTARISDATATRVMQAAADLNYRPNPVARMLVSGRSNVIGVVFQRGSFFTSWSGFTAEVMRGVATEAVELGYDVMLHTREVSGDEEAWAIASGRMDGVLVLRDAGDRLSQELARQGFPAVRFFCRPEDGGEPYVDADNRQGARIATEHLIGLGHRRILMVRGPERSTSSQDRVQGYRDAMGAAGLEAVEPIGAGTEDERERFIAMMRGSGRPTAVFVWSDETAFQILSILRNLGLSVPDDVSVIGFDSLDSCNRSAPPLTSVRQPIAEMAQEAVRLLVALIQGTEPARRQALYPLLIDLRGSTAPCPSPPHKEVSHQS